MLRVDEVKVLYSAAEERVFSIAKTVFKGKPTRTATVEYHLRVAANQEKRNVIYVHILNAIALRSRL